jgi:hypothetical protein
MRSLVFGFADEPRISLRGPITASFSNGNASFLMIF